MAHEWREQQGKEALAEVDAFIAENPDYTRQGVDQPGQGVTNWGVFARRDGETVAFKVFCDTERKEREGFAFKHWGPSGLVPRLIYDAGPRMIVMSYLPGTYLPSSREVDGEGPWRRACREVGHAIGSLTRITLGAADRADFESRYYDGLGPLEAYLGRIIELGRSVQARDPDFSDHFWKENLDFIESQLEAIFSQPRVLYHRDIGNLHVKQGRFIGFFDLEMCRVGCASMQLASASGMLHGDQGGWQLFREGWQAATGSQLSLDDRKAAAAANHALHWREITRYLSYDGTPGTGFHWASPADPARYREGIETVQRMLEVE
ncbi:MAG: aminoglycoside phosphotransferase family protein [Planctomycetota bacterium]|jgi:hypothetical protein|nr:aminoglycoside phosphotransferase family protein [Planctomycetota bacterium]